MARWLTLSTLLLIALTLLHPTSAFADEPVVAWDWQVVSPNSEYVLVVLARPGDGESSIVDESESLRRSYPVSGVYRNDNSDVPLYKLDWYGINGNVSNDGQYVVRYGLHDYQDYDGVAIAFYQNGTELKLYTIRDLVREPETLPHTVSHLSWLKTSTFDPNAQTVAIETDNGESYLFDITTGNILENTAPQRNFVTSLFEWLTDLLAQFN